MCVISSGGVLTHQLFPPLVSGEYIRRHAVTERPFTVLLLIQTLDHDAAPQYLGPTLSTTNTLTAPHTQSKTTYVYRVPHSNATTAGSTKHQRADTRSTLPHINQQNKNKTTKGNSAPIFREQRIARPRRKIYKDKVRRY